MLYWLGCFKLTTYLQLETLFTYTQNRWMLNITYSQSVLFVPSTRGLNLGIGRPPLVCLRRETHQVVDHFAITCVGWCPARTPWQTTNNPARAPRLSNASCISPNSHQLDVCFLRV